MGKPDEVIEQLAAYAYPPRSGVQADLVMKGGITSGVVYPLAVCELAKTYTFRNVGGSSAGGIAAAFAAAAEHARDTGGFQRLARVPQLLGGDLAALFQPSRGTRPLYEVFRSVKSKRGGGGAKIPRFLWYLVSRKVGASLLGAGVVLLCGLWVALLAGGAPRDAGDWGRVALRLLPLAPVALLAAFVGAIAGTIRATLRELPRNGHGLFMGSRGPDAGEGTKPFTDWMHEQLQVVVGRPGVLTFGDLWGPAARAAYEEADTTTAKGRENALRSLDAEVRLEMMTTNVTQRRPMRVPFFEDRLMLCPKELARWFPPDVLRHLVDRGRPATRDGAALHCPEHPDEQLRRLPEPPELPVVVAVRMTLSFPGLISAVPLWVVDFAHPDQPLARCWFSDGGISSNFPIHFFDALLPSRPTFAISLGPYPEGYEQDDVYYPDPSVSSQPPVRPSESLPQFFGAILDTMQNWSDVGQSMLPGYRDRIVEVRQRPNEGGMNLDMAEDVVLGLAVRGHRAALRLTDPRRGFDFEKHRQVRYELAMTQLQRSVSRMCTYFDDPLPSGAPSYRDLVTALGPGRVPRTEVLLAFGRAEPPKRRTKWADFTVEPRRPEPDLRLVARF